VDTDATEGSHGPRPVEIEVVRGALTRMSLLAQTLSGAHQGDAERYADNFAETLGDALHSEAAPVVWIIREGAVYYAGTEVSGNDLVIRAIVARLQEEGVSAITLLPGVSRPELIELAHLLARPRTTDGAVDSVAMLGAELWRLGLTHVHFETLATRLATEADEQVRPVELIRRLTAQLGVGEDVLEPHAYMELAATLGGVRALADAPRADGADRPATGSMWGRALREVRASADVPDDILSLTVTESLRAADSPDACTALATRWLDRVRDAFEAGNPDLAGSMLRPLLVCADPRFRPPGFDAAPVLAALSTFLGRPTRIAIGKGVARHPQTDDWMGPLFTLGQCAHADTLLDLAAIGASFSAGPIREALGDGLAGAIDRIEGVTIRDLMATAADDALPTLLQAARRFTDPTLIEPLLARMRHDNPRIRESALLALRAQQSPRIKAAARDAITDRDRSVRLEALRYVSVYRDVESTDVVEQRIRSVSARDVNLDELRALAIAWLHTSRGAALTDIEALAGATTDRHHPDLAAACIAALAKAGQPGRTALDRLGRSQPHLRPLLRDHTAPRAPERRP